MTAFCIAIFLSGALVVGLLFRKLKEKNARYSDFNHQRVEKRGQKLEETGQFRGMEDMGGKFTRGFKPRFGEVRQVKEVQGATVVDDKGKEIGRASCRERV